MIQSSNFSCFPNPKSREKIIRQVKRECAAHIFRRRANVKYFVSKTSSQRSFLRFPFRAEMYPTWNMRAAINKRERKEKIERTRSGTRQSFAIGIIRLQNRQIATTAASTLLTGRSTEWINRACYTFTRWTGL